MMSRVRLLTESELLSVIGPGKWCFCWARCLAAGRSLLSLTPCVKPHCLEPFVWHELLAAHCHVRITGCLLCCPVSTGKEAEVDRRGLSSEPQQYHFQQFCCFPHPQSAQQWRSRLHFPMEEGRGCGVKVHARSVP